MEKEKYEPRGRLGHFGLSRFNEDYNKKIELANYMVDEYNLRINTFTTKDENDEFAFSMEKAILKKINAI